jgi:hypothetical protein
VEYRRLANTLNVKECRVMEDVVEYNKKVEGAPLVMTKSQKQRNGRASKAGTKLSDVQKASREKRGFQGS